MLYVHTKETHVNNERRDADDAYTGPTIVLPRRKANTPGPVPRRRRPIRPLIRRVVLIAGGVLALALIGLYLQIAIVSNRIVVADSRRTTPIGIIGGANLLLIGVDERPDHPDEGVRSDTLIVVHLDAAGRWASMLSIPRDSRVAIAGTGEAKINTAYGYGYAHATDLYGPQTTPQQGGMALAAETVEQFLGLRIDYAMQINFDGFARLIDALGGITIDVPRLIVDEEYPTPDFGTRRIEFQPGVQRMDGATALIYARTRHADSDFGRAERQQQVIRAITTELRSHSFAGQALLLPGILGSLEGTVVTTLPLARPDILLALGWLASGLSPDSIGQYRITPESVPIYREEGSDLIWDSDGVHALVAEFLTRPSEAAEQAQVQVFNGTGVGGLAGQVTLELERQGFMVLPADNAPDAEKTVVYDLTGKPRTSRRLGDVLGVEVRRGAPEGIVSAADIVVVLGRDRVRP